MTLNFSFHLIPSSFWVALLESDTRMRVSVQLFRPFGLSLVFWIDSYTFFLPHGASMLQWWISPRTHLALKYDDDTYLGNVLHVFWQFKIIVAALHSRQVLRVVYSGCIYTSSLRVRQGSESKFWWAGLLYPALCYQALPFHLWDEILWGLSLRQMNGNEHVFEAWDELHFFAQSTKQKVKHGRASDDWHCQSRQTLSRVQLEVSCWHDELVSMYPK